MYTDLCGAFGRNLVHTVFLLSFFPKQYGLCVRGFTFSTFSSSSFLLISSVTSFVVFSFFSPIDLFQFVVSCSRLFVCERRALAMSHRRSQRTNVHFWNSITRQDLAVSHQCSRSNDTVIRSSHYESGENQLDSSGIFLVLTCINTCVGDEIEYHSCFRPIRLT